MDQDGELRAFLQRILEWEDAHLSVDSAIEGVPPEIRGVRPAGYPHSLWQLLEHIRICQRDILDFSRDPNYREMRFDEYWPKTAAPPSNEAWQESVAAFRRDREELKQLATDPKIDLFAKIPHGSGQTYIRELILAADHNAYHAGQLVAVRRLLGNWKG